MRILLTEGPGENGYIESLINAYKSHDCEVVCGASNFFSSNFLPDILHIHWPERLYVWHAQSTLENVDIYEQIKKRLEWYRKNNVVIVHTIHNIKCHENKIDLHDRVYRLIIEYADVLVHHCKKSVDLLAEYYQGLSCKEKDNIVCHHGDYLIHHKKIEKKIARAKYGIPDDKIVTINFGKQRPYKNEKFIISAFSGVSDRSKFLIIAGQFDYTSCNNFFNRMFLKLRNKQRQLLRSNNKKYIYKLFPVSELPYIMSCADIVFIGQSDALNSGLIALAATYALPVVIPDVGCFEESVEGWVYKKYVAGEKNSAVEALSSLYAELRGVKEENFKWLEKNSWERHAGKIISSAEAVKNIM